MATNKKSTSKKKKPQSKKGSNTKKNNSSKVPSFKAITISNETVSLSLVTTGFLLFFSVFINDTFILTNFFKSFAYVLFGYLSYIVPIIILSIGAYTFITKNPLSKNKYILFSLLVLALCSLFHVLIQTSLTPELYLFSSPNFAIRSGGIIGMLFGGILLTLIGKFLSSLFLIIAIIAIIAMLLSKNFDDIKGLSSTVALKAKDTYISFTEKLDNSIEFDEEDKDYIEKDIVFTNKKTSTDTINISSTNNDLDDLDIKSNLDISKGFGIKRKREPNKVSENNYKKDRNRSQNRDQKPNLQLNMRKINPFAKKTKVKLFDFSEQIDDQFQSPLKDIDKYNHKKQEESYLINMRGNKSSKGQSVKYVEDSYDDTFENNKFIEPEPEQTTIKINSPVTEDFDINLDANKKKIAEQEETIRTLKHELDRQMFLFQDSQKEFQTQKNVEKNLLKIINAQRETIEKQASAIKAFELSLNVINTNSQKTSLNEEVIKDNLTTSEQKENVLFDITDETDFTNNIEAKAESFSPIEPDNSSIYDDFEDFNNNKNTDSFIDEIDLTNNLQTESYIDSFKEKYATQDTDNDYVYGIPNTNDILSYEEDSLTHEALQTITKGLVDDIEDTNIYDDFNVDNFDNDLDEDIEDSAITNTDFVQEPTYTSPNSSIFKSDDAPKYNAPIKHQEPEKKEKHIYTHPTVDFLIEKPHATEQTSKIELIANSKKLESTLRSFGVVATVNEVSKGPTVTRYEIQPGPGVKVSKIANLSDDLALNLAAKSIRIQAPIPGKRAVGIEVPNETTEMVYLREVLDDENFKNFKSKLAFGIGKDISGKIVVADLATMPHLLIAGATGAGKSVCVNTLITSIIYKSSPDEVKLLMIDPKVVELSVYNGIPHLLIPVVTDPKKAAASLNWAVREMEKRYKLFADKNVRDLKGYNAAMALEDGPLEPQIVIIIDELADLMMTASKEVEAAIIRIAQMARAAGIHLIIATQRPTADVITGLIKSNIPSRLAFSVSSGLDSKIILDETGAEKLLGKGDMLFKPMGSPEPHRIQGAFISDKEVESIVSFLKTETDPDDMREIIEEITSSANPQSSSNSPSDTVDEIFEEVVDFIITKQKASTSLIQRQFRVGFNRAARIIDELENFGVIGPDEGNKPRKVLMSMSEWNNKFRT